MFTQLNTNKRYLVNYIKKPRTGLGYFWPKTYMFWVFGPKTKHRYLKECCQRQMFKTIFYKPRRGLKQTHTKIFIVYKY